MKFSTAATVFSFASAALAAPLVRRTADNGDTATGTLLAPTGTVEITSVSESGHFTLEYEFLNQPYAKTVSLAVTLQPIASFAHDTRAPWVAANGTTTHNSNILTTEIYTGPSCGAYHLVIDELQKQNDALVEIRGSLENAPVININCVEN